MTAASPPPSPPLPAAASSTAQAPRSRGVKPWKKPPAAASGARINVPSLRVSAAKNEARRSQRDAVRTRVKEIEDRDKAEREAEKKRIEEKRKRKAENELKGSKFQVITNMSKIKKMSKKQRRQLTTGTAK
eukprot:CAMPEP_0174893932 /NCGR_PEP_ID=MMETSP0167-20121228/8652_1 /TAXON_ID=38298 /ORGANISM="Rhodella maculata, Strain CCMP736" /LENGTH=130 /DNA_ID=CAMNT_0016132863 /DNA_START=50 /DNA_END=442 /DNA_ORIENTATION=-